MSYGLLFVPPEGRLQPSLAQVYHDVVEQGIRSRIHPPDPELQRATRNLSRLFSTGTDDPDVLARAKYGSVIRDDSHTISTIASDFSPARQRQKPREQFPSITEALSTLNKAPGGKFSVPKVVDHYQPRLQGRPMEGVVNPNTPKAWSLKPADLHDDCRSLCSKVIDVSGTPSALQSTLLECGRLSLADSLQEQRQAQALTKAVKQHKKTLLQHSKWMRRGMDRESWHHEGSELQPQPPVSSSSGASVHSLSTVSHSAGDSWIQLSRSGAGHGGRGQRKPRPTDGKDAYLGAMDVQNGGNSLNPFRRDHQTRSLVRQTRRLPRPVNPRDHMDYKDDVFVRSSSSFNAVIQPSLLIGATPSQQELSTTLFALTRKQILCYSARVVEVGSLLRHFRNSRHATPGLQAVFALHEACVAAAKLSTNPFILSRSQLLAVLEQQLPWVSTEALGRALMAFDNTNTGYVRYVRLTATCLAGLEPAMASLAVSLDKDSTRVWKQLLGLTGEAGAAGGGAAAVSEAEFKEFKAELLVVRFLHRLYGEAAGSFADPGAPADYEPRVALHDLQEMLTSCAGSPEDEKEMAALLLPLQQHFLQALAPALPVDAQQVARHERLRMMVGSAAVTAEQLVRGLLGHLDLLRAFVRQVKAFRRAALPFTIQSSRSIEDSISLFSSSQSGTRRGV